MRKILVTGGAGFIGSNLIEFLLKEGHFVRCLDNFSTGKRENIEPFLKNPDFELIEGDIRALETCRNAVKGMDGVTHQAALGSVPRSIKDPMTTTAVNILGFVNMLFAAVETGTVRRFVYASSSSVYGDNPTLPKVENAIGAPLSPYAITKQTDELFASNFAAIYGLPVVGLRYFNVFGPRQDPNGEYAAVIPRFATALAHRTAPRIYGDGSVSRDFTFVRNVVQANCLALFQDNAAILGQVFNIACGERITLIELFEILRSALAVFDSGILKVEAEFLPPRPGDIPHSLANIDKAKTILGYHPEFLVRDGLKLAAEWYYSTSK